MRLGLFFLLACGAALASDQQREQDYAALLQASTQESQSLWLQARDDRFIALWIEAEKPSAKQAAILLHDAGEHPDQRPLIHELRNLLPQHGWSSLSLQMPLREPDANLVDYYALFDEASQRITEGVRFLQDKKIERVALIGHGVGAMIAIYALNRQPTIANAVVTIGLPLIKQPLTPVQMDDLIKGLSIPFLDLYAEFDLTEVTDSARDRRLLSQENPMYRQVRLEGENHAYRADPGLVGKRIYSWLSTPANQ